MIKQIAVNLSIRNHMPQLTHTWMYAFSGSPLSAVSILVIGCSVSQQRVVGTDNIITLKHNTLDIAGYSSSLCKHSAV